jgi:hypothetical protein
MAVLWGDPQLAVGFKRPATVALSFLAVSETGFNNAKGTDGNIDHWLSATAAIDSVCVTLSDNGGQSWASLYCKRPAGIGSLGTDQPSVGIDKDGNVFVAVIDATTDVLLIYQLLFFITSKGATFVDFGQLVVDPQMGDGWTPRIARDQDGELYVASASSIQSKVRLCHITAGSLASPGSCDFIGDIGTTVGVSPKANSPSIGNVRTGETVSFGVNRVKSSSSQVPGYTDFYFAYHESANTPLRVDMTVCRQSLFPFTCKTVPQWSTSNINLSPQGAQFQPTLSVTDMSSDQSGGNPEVRYAFYQYDSSPEVAPGKVEVFQAKLTGSPFGGPVPTATFEGLLGVPQPKVCTADYSGVKYWGDFFGYLFLPPASPGILPRYLTVYSSDEGLGCAPVQPNILQGDQLHLESWFWLD